jgi:hypothetical protein
MPDKEPTRDERIRGERDLGEMERVVLYLLTDPTTYPTVWSVADIGREMQYYDPEALVHPLVSAGLAHIISDEFVFATPAAFHMVSLTGQIA